MAVKKKKSPETKVKEVAKEVIKEESELVTVGEVLESPEDVVSLPEESEVTMQDIEEGDEMDNEEGDVQYIEEEDRQDDEKTENEKPEEDVKVMESAAVLFESESPKKAPERRVKIRPNRNHTCNIGGVFYDLKAGKQMDVPENVKSILSSAGLLSPL